MEKKRIIGIIFGGNSGEHEISLLSAKSIIENINRNLFEIVLIGISKTGKWHLYNEDSCLVNKNDPKNIKLGTPEGSLLLGHTGEAVLYLLGGNKMILREIKLDAVFPVLHGTFGEDGTIQGLFEMAGVPYVGAGVGGSFIGFDKEVTKRLLKEAGIPSADFYTVQKGQLTSSLMDTLVSRLGLPMFVKPCNLGSSVGIAKIKTFDQVEKYALEAFRYDNKIIFEKNIPGRELECAVFGNEQPVASPVGEIIPAAKHEYYSYDAKYIDPEGAALSMPAKLNKNSETKIRELAIKTFKVLNCEGMARVDFFYNEKDDEIFVNEINTIPGFTTISMYPKLMNLAGYSYQNLITGLLEAAIDRFNKNQALCRSYY